MRDLVLAQSLQGEIIFACQALKGAMIERIPYEVKILKSNDVEELITLIQTLKINFLIIDHYGIDALYERTIKEATGVKILSFDDTYKAHHCDILLNHNLYADAKRYENLVPKHCELRLGSPLIRDEFKEEKRQKREKIYDVLIAMGGSDSANLTQKIVEALPKTLHIAIVTTTANAHLIALQHYIENKPNITLHINTQNVAKLLHQSRFGITTPSVMVHEVLFMELPFIAIKVAPNQDDMFHYLNQHSYPVLKEWNASSFAQLYHTYAH